MDQPQSHRRFCRRAHFPRAGVFHLLRAARRHRQASWSNTPLLRAKNAGHCPRWRAPRDFAAFAKAARCRPPAGPRKNLSRFPPERQGRTKHRPTAAKEPAQSNQAPAGLPPLMRTGSPRIGFVALALLLAAGRHRQKEPLPSSRKWRLLRVIGRAEKSCGSARLPCKKGTTPAAWQAA